MWYGEEKARRALMVDYYSTYGIDIRLLDTGELDPYFVAALMDGLPPDGQVAQYYNPDAVYSPLMWVLNSIDYSLKLNLYAQCDPKKRPKKPDPILKPKPQRKVDPNVQQLPLSTLRSLVDFYTQGTEGGD